MAHTQESYLITTQDASDPQQLVDRLNFIFQRISDRLDRIEGSRGDPTIEGKLVISQADDTDQVHGINSI